MLWVVLLSLIHSLYHTKPLWQCQSDNLLKFALECDTSIGCEGVDSCPMNIIGCVLTLQCEGFLKLNCGVLMGYKIAFLVGIIGFPKIAEVCKLSPFNTIETVEETVSNLNWSLTVLLRCSNIFSSFSNCKIFRLEMSATI